MVLAQLVRDSLENTGGHTGGEYRATLVETGGGQVYCVPRQAGECRFTQQLCGSTSAVSSGRQCPSSAGELVVAECGRVW